MKCRNGCEIKFGMGAFDNWCVWVTRPDGVRHAPKDVEYFTELKEIYLKCERVYEDFCCIFKKTDASISREIQEYIRNVTLEYPPQQSDEAEMVLNILYAGMIAEEKKAFSVLKKRVKMLGVYQVLILGIAPSVAANFSKGKEAYEIDKICRSYGF